MSTKILNKILRRDEYLLQPMFETQRPSAFLFENRGEKKITVVSKTQSSPVYTVPSEVLSNQSVKVNFLEKVTSFCLSEKSPCEEATPVSGIIHLQGTFDLFINGKLQAIDIPARAVPAYLTSQHSITTHSSETGRALESSSYYDISYSCYLSGFDINLFSNIVSYSLDGSEESSDMDEFYDNWVFLDWYQEEGSESLTTEVNIMSDEITTLTINFSTEIDVDAIAPLYNSKYSVSTDRKSMTFYYPMIQIPTVHEILEPYSGVLEG